MDQFNKLYPPLNPTVGKAWKGNLRLAKTVDLHLRNMPRVKNKQLAAAKLEYKASQKKAVEAIYRYNFNGIAEHGIAWNHMNRSQRTKWFKEMLMSDKRMPPQVIEWAKQRGLM